MNGVTTLLFVGLAVYLFMWTTRYIQEQINKPIHTPEELSNYRVLDELAAIEEKRAHHIVTTADSEYRKWRQR